MEFLSAETYDVMIFNEDNSLAVKFDSTQEVSLTPTDSGEYELTVKNAFLDMNFLKYLGNSSKSTDYERYLGNTATTISIGKGKQQRCKIIMKTIVHDPMTNKPQEMKVEIPYAINTTKLSLLGSIDDVYGTGATFTVKEAADGDFFKIYI